VRPPPRRLSLPPLPRPRSGGQIRRSGERRRRAPPRPVRPPRPRRLHSTRAGAGRSSLLDLLPRGHQLTVAGHGAPRRSAEIWWREVRWSRAGGDGAGAGQWRRRPWRTPADSTAPATAVRRARGMAATRRMSGPRPTRLAFAQDCPPLAIIAAAKIAGVSLTTDPSLSPDSVPTLYLGSG
jgi:hypothetical protein